MNQPEQKGFSQSTLRFFVRHVGQAAARQMEREHKISGLSSQVSTLKKSALSDKPIKKKLEKGFEELDSKIKSLINEERTLVLNQRKEEEILEELKERIDLLEEKVYGLGHVHSMTSKEHLRRIEEVSKKLKKVTSKLEERRKKEEEKKKKALQNKKNEEKSKRNSIRELEKMIKEAEQSHKDLKKKKVPEEHLNNLKERIETHKKKLKQLKS